MGQDDKKHTQVAFFTIQISSKRKNEMGTSVLSPWSTERLELL